MPHLDFTATCSHLFVFGKHTEILCKNPVSSSWSKQNECEWDIALSSTMFLAYD